MGIESEGQPARRPESASAAETLAARVPLTAEEHRAMVSTLTQKYLAAMFVAAGIAYHGLALGHWSESTDQTALKLMTMYGLAGIAMLAFGWRSHYRPPPLEWALHIGGIAFLVVTVTVTIAYALVKDPSSLYLYLMIQLAAGAVVHDRRWLAAIVTLGFVCWGLISLSVPNVGWVKSIGYFVGFSTITIVIHVLRDRALVGLEELRRAAERVSSAKSELLANVSHEVRTPMNGVLGLSNVLLDGELEPKQRKMVVAIRESAEALVGIVDEILDFSQLQQGQIELQTAPFDLRALVDGVVELMQPRAESKGLQLEAETVGISSQRFMGDGGRIRQVVLNFVNNAIKFTDSGSVEIRAELIRRSEKARVRLSVTDTGAGIAEDALESVFSRYERSSDEVNRSRHGTGLGLAISKQLVELMGGEIGVTSAVDEGTRFWAELDLGFGPETTLRVVDSDGTGQVLIREGASVLVAEDDPTSRLVTEALLRKLSCRVDVARDGREALDMATRGAYDIVFMDCHMPMLDGFQATKRIRQTRSEAELPVVALTASVAEEDRIRCLDAGMNDLVGKPVRASMLAKALEHWVPLAGSGRSKSVSTLPPPPALDMDMVRRLVTLDGEDDDFIEEVLLGYVDQLGDCTREIDEALKKGDMDAAQRAAHTVKGASKQIGATRVGELLGEIGRATDVEEARNLLELVVQEKPRVAEAVQGLLSRPRRTG